MRHAVRTGRGGARLSVIRPYLANTVCECVLLFGAYAIIFILFEYRLFFLQNNGLESLERQKAFIPQD